MNVIDTPITDLRIIELPFFEDQRGNFCKTFHRSSLAKHGIEFDIKESFFSFSRKGVVRGMHFQLPPHDHAKIVFAPVGRIYDVVVDLRIGSQTYGQHRSQELSADNHLAYYIPSGFAHGFQSLDEDSMIYYLVSSEHNTQADSGVLYNSMDIQWPLPITAISTRDLSFPSLEDFHSPFKYSK